jgi:hypothetical protein
MFVLCHTFIVNQQQPLVQLDFLEFVTFLLQSIGTYVDPTVLVEKIKNGMQVPGLKHSLVKMLYQYNLQVRNVSAGSVPN